MLASTARFVPRVSRATYRVANVSRRSMMTLGDSLKGREKVEEDLYMRAQEEAWKEKLRALRAQEAAAREQVEHDEVVSPVKADIAAMLAESGDKVSDEGLEILAKWKLSL
eukprot:Nitzschia sp. Nitz4//scaffold8_size234185//199563//199977//NITZ4_001293-RA/size234185-augustus-gene-0.278-mRNA-1//-1//CDS//3329559914//7125//frame0